mmetsp:Transcript_28712/g.5197  ORF Transcript_28712/g.5197 Transcript_28712/m.5197 type:complete len:98 (-) Transcript_28712:25-318(-)
MHFIVSSTTVVLPAVTPAVQAFTFQIVFYKVSDIITTVCPGKSTLSMLHTVLEFPCVVLPICKLFLSLTMLSIIQPIPVIYTAILSFHSSFTICHIH